MSSSDDQVTDDQWGEAMRLQLDELRADAILTRVKKLERSWRTYQRDHRPSPVDAVAQLVLGE